MRKLIFLSALLGLAVWLLPSEPAVASEVPAYSLTDVGTFGGPQGFLNIPGVPITPRGTVLGTADTTIADPNYPNFNPFLVGLADPVLPHAFEWRDGTLIDLGALPGKNGSAVFQINRAGVGVGLSGTGAIDPVTGYPAEHAVLFQHGTVTDLGTLPGGHESFALSINARGEVAGFANNGVPDPHSFFAWGTQTHSFIWQDGVMHDIGTLGGPDALMNNMNARGQIAGDSYTNDTPNPVTGVPTTDPFLWTYGHMRDLGTLGGTQSVTYWLNDTGEVVGQDNVAGDQSFHPYLWDGHQLRDLGTLGGTFGAANYISDGGTAVGWTTLPGDNTAHAFVWRNGVMTDLTGAASSQCTVAAAINSGGTIVGGTCAEDDALVWMNDHQYDLNTIDGTTGVTLTNAQGVNDRGQIVAIGHLTNGDQHVFLLTPNRHPAQASVATAPRTGSNTPARQGSPRRRTLRSGRALRTRWWRLSREARPRGRDSKRGGAGEARHR
jgi:probable HAF family extracellular repeat protein